MTVRTTNPARCRALAARHDAEGERVVFDPGPFRWDQLHRIGRRQVGVTDSGEVRPYLAERWAQLPHDPRYRWYDAWVDEKGLVLVVGTGDVYTNDERAMIASFGPGKTWVVRWEGPRQRNTRLSAIRSVGSGEHLAVGSDGLVVRGRASGWEVEPSGTEADLHALWTDEEGRAIAVGMHERRRGRGVILHHDGERWTEARAPVDPLDDVWGTDAQHVYAVGGFDDDDGARAVAVRFDGKAWSSFHDHSNPEGEHFTRIAGNSPRDVFALRAYLHTGYATWSLHHYDGRAWRVHAKGEDYAGALSVSPGEVMVATDNGPRRWGCHRLAGG